MTPEQIQKMAEGFPPSSIGKDHEEVIVWLAEQHVALQEQVQKLAADKEKYLVECMATKIAIQYLKAGESDFTLNTPATDAVIREIGAKAVAPYAEALRQLHDTVQDCYWKDAKSWEESDHPMKVASDLISKFRAGEVS